MQGFYPRGSFMADRFNTIAGWTLFSGVVALGLASVSGHYFQADKEHRPEKMGYEIEGVAAEGGEKAVAIEALLATADAAKGEAAFKKCMACHTINQGGANGIGPNLYAVFGAAVGSHVAGFAYSDALKAKGGKWDWATMNEWLTNPKKFAEGTKMSFAGISDPAERANLMVYLNAQGSNLPLPAVPAAAEGAEAGAEVAAAVVGDAAKGEQVFKKCTACHTVNAGGANGIGPNLNGVAGAAVGAHAAGFAYSDALKGKGGVWDDATLDAWLTNPRAFAAGNKMTFAGLSNPQDRADVIAYIKAAK